MNEDLSVCVLEKSKAYFFIKLAAPILIPSTYVKVVLYLQLGLEIRANNLSMNPGLLND